jgi:hypothetical protein
MNNWKRLSLDCFQPDPDYDWLEPILYGHIIYPTWESKKVNSPLFILFNYIKLNSYRPYFEHFIWDVTRLLR